MRYLPSTYEDVSNRYCLHLTLAAVFEATVRNKLPGQQNITLILLHQMFHAQQLIETKGNGGNVFT